MSIYYQIVLWTVVNVLLFSNIRDWMNVPGPISAAFLIVTILAVLK